MEKLTLGSLFSGIGGFELGFERTGQIKTIWQVEIDDYCRRVLAKHWPAVQRFAHIRDVGAHNLPYADILCGGFPCQDISNAGKRAGIDGERSGLWSEYARVIRELCSVQRGPRYVVVENVAALLGRGMERVLGDLAACGYDAEWQSIRASDVGAPHRRERIWIVAYPACDLRRASRDAGHESSNGRHPILADAAESRRASGPCGPGNAGQREGRMPEPDGRSSDVADAERNGRRESPKVFRGWESEPALRGENISDATIQGLSLRQRSALGTSSGNAQPERLDSVGREWWAVEPDVGRVAHGVPARVDRLRGLGNAIVPQIAEFIGHRIVADFFRAVPASMPRASGVSA